MSGLKVKLTMIEEVTMLGLTLEKPRRIVKLIKDGEETVYLIPRKGDPVVVVEMKHLSPDKFQKLWEDLK